MEKETLTELDKQADQFAKVMFEGLISGVRIAMHEIENGRVIKAHETLKKIQDLLQRTIDEAQKVWDQPES